MAGMLLTPSDILAVYNTGDSMMKWERNSEQRLEVFLEMDICRYRLPGQYSGIKPSAVVFGASMEVMPILMGAGGDQRHHCFVNEDHYSHFYFLSNDCKGEFVLQLLCRPEKKAMLDSILMQTLSAPK